MRDYLTLSWARFSKDVQSHSLQISKILSHPAPRAGDLIKLDASATSKSDSASAGGPDTSLEVIARFPGGLDFGRGLVDINFTMWPLFKALNIDNVLTICEVMVCVILCGYGTHSAESLLLRQQGGFSSFLAILPCSGCVSLWKRNSHVLSFYG